MAAWHMTVRNKDNHASNSRSPHCGTAWDERPQSQLSSWTMKEIPVDMVSMCTGPQ
jgi:hypothetical protein